MSIDYAARRAFTVAGREVIYSRRHSTSRMGRFGGGWQWEVGIQLGPRGFRGTVILNLLVASVRINPRPVTA